MTRSKRIRPWLVVSSVLVVLMAAFCAFLLFCYGPEEDALLALESNSEVIVTSGDKQIVFEPVGDIKAGVILYPGANVDARAYAPLMQSLAERGIFGVIAVMPHEMAFLDSDAAQGIMDKYGDVTNEWYLCGHSLGGSMAASYLSSHAEQFRGIILLASYSTEDIKSDDLCVLSIYGSEDGVLNRGRLDKYAENLPSDNETYVIEGGNHAYYALYGEQSGDGVASISQSEQIRIASDVILDFVERH